MRTRHNFFLLLAVLVATTPSLSPASAAPEGEGTVTSAVQVTSNPAPLRAHSSPQIAVNPKNRELVIVEADIRGNEACAVHISVDDGRTWSRGGDPMAAPFTDCTLHADYGPYASMTFTPSGVLYVAFVASMPDKRAKELVPRSVFLARSDDGGRNFTTATVFEAPPEDAHLRVNKGPMLAADPNRPYVYVGWRQGAFSSTKKFSTMVAASRDGGRTFAAPVDLTDERGGDYPALAVDGDGALHAVYWTRTDPGQAPAEPPVLPIYYLRSADQGKTFRDRVELDPGNQDNEQPPLIVADVGSRSLYVAWNAHHEPKDRAPGFSGDHDVFFLASHDSGSTWGRKLVLNDDAGSGANQYMPGIAIAPDGRVDVAWYDYRNSVTGPNEGFQDVYYASSYNGGGTFGSNMRTNDRSIDRSVGVWDNNIGSHHNVGIASTRAGVYFAWQDSRNRDTLFQPEDVYMAKLNVNGPTPLSVDDGDPRLAWALLGAGVTAGATGLALFAFVAINRRRSTTATTAPSGASS